MRNLAIFGAGLPVLVLSGAIASGAISELSGNEGSNRNVLQAVEIEGVVVDLSAFVSAGLVHFQSEQVRNEEDMIVAQAAGVGQTSPFEQFPVAQEPVLRNNDSDRDESDALVVSVTPVIVVAEPPTSLPAAKRSTPAKQVTARTRSLSSPTGNTKPSKFRMPWQTGVFQ